MSDAVHSAPSYGPLDRLLAWTNRIPMSLVQLLLRITVALPFWKSGLTKWDGLFSVSPSATYLFSSEFKLHLFGEQIAYPFPGLMAFLSGLGETALPILLVLGFGTRFAALGLLVMTGIIQLTVPDAWSTFHLPWAAMLIAILAYGPGKLSVDYLMK